jgi:hypothetical protein
MVLGTYILKKGATMIGFTPCKGKLSYFQNRVVEHAFQWVWGDIVE